MTHSLWVIGYDVGPMPSWTSLFDVIKNKANIVISTSNDCASRTLDNDQFFKQNWYLKPCRSLKVYNLWTIKILVKSFYSRNSNLENDGNLWFYTIVIAIWVPNASQTFVKHVQVVIVGPIIRQGNWCILFVTVPYQIANWFIAPCL